ncbi:hypothetical protein ACET3X_004329 [Alternaria dauci]|uniref:Glutaminase A central domain-containing protein n=1 Tax=Alternaria dauci TaxID=48095 RepID=A0ABR3UMQ0_9PLEO
MHDIGRFYPNAIGYFSSSIPDKWGEEAMPVEESANMIILAYAYFMATNNAEFLATHFDILKRWAVYVKEESLFPELQTTTDDFNDTIANNTNLAIKDIVAMNCMGGIASAVGEIDLAAKYVSLAFDYYQLWAASSIDATNTHTLLAYQLSTSYSILYNIYPALLFNLRSIPKSLFLMESAFYPTVAQKYGVPLDNRHLWTKSDWEMWAAATSLPQTRALFVESLAKWINETVTDKALTDHYMTTESGNYTDYPFVARPVVGGHFSLLAMRMFGRHGVLNEGDG